MTGMGTPSNSVWFTDGLSLAERAPEARPLWEAHSAEVGGFGGRKPEFDVGLLARLESQSAVHSTLAFNGPKLVGYLIWYLAETTLEFKGLRSAMQGPWFLAKPHRGAGVGEAMYRSSLQALKAQGFTVAFPHRWARSPEGLEAMFAGLGAVPLERTWWLELGDGA